MGLAAGLLDNRTVLEKADLALADLTAGGGLLQPAQAQKFIRILLDESVILKQGTVVPMKSPKQLIEKIRFAGRILRAGAEAAAVPAGDRTKPDLSQVELDAQLFKAEVRLNNEVLEDSIERGQLRQTIMQLMAEAISRDIDEVIIRGDTTSPDPFLAKLNGLLKQATSNIVDAQNQSTNKGIFRDMLKSMPSAFLRNKREMRFFTSVDSEIDYRDSLAERATVVGDKFLEQDEPVAYSGVPVVDVPLFPENLGAGNNATNILLTDPKNVNIGIWRNIRVETDKLVSEGVLIIVATLRFDVKFAEETAVVKAINVKVGA
ncbi:MAG: phage major capsid protein [Alphaproteobacteria bacterium]